MKGDKPIKVNELKVKLSTIWDVTIDVWHITLMGKGYYTLNLNSDEPKSSVFARGTLQPGIFRISQWVQNFNLNFQRQTNSQVCVRFHDLAMGYLDPTFLLDITNGIGEPLHIVEKTLCEELGTYTRVLVDIDFTKDLPKEILIQRERFEFLVTVEYENCPYFCKHCNIVGYDVSQYILVRREDMPVEQPRWPRSPGNNVRRFDEKARYDVKDELAIGREQPCSEEEEQNAAINLLL